ncbi:MAG: hypothetical protein KDD11_00810 [Acidobacteria bacterium]|nr:hypothetical protein [Acidobacteriota bacterium]
MTRRRLTWVIGGGALLLLALHVWFWYWPRARAATPASGDAPVALLLDDGFDGAVWVPYPHQNLAALPGQGDPWSYWQAAGLLSRRRAMSLPAFGPFVLPPSREMTVAWSTGGERLAVAARVYPTVAWIARLAGRLAGNPWLAGGEVSGRQGTVTVRWRGTLWTATRGEDVADPATVATGAPLHLDAQPLALLRLDDPPAKVPAGLFTLRRAPRGFAVSLVGSDGAPLGDSGDVLDRSLLEPPLALLGLSASPERRQALALFEEDGIPAFAVFERGVGGPSSSRLPLAGMGVAALLGTDGYHGEHAGWTLMASGSSTFERAGALVPALEEGLDRARGASSSRLRVAVLAEPSRAERALGALTRVLAVLPGRGGSEARRLEALHRLLAPLAGFHRGSLVILENPDRFELRVER